MMENNMHVIESAGTEKAKTSNNSGIDVLSHERNTNGTKVNA